MTNATVVIVDGFPVLNPFSWSAFLPPDTAYHLDVTKYVMVGTSGIFVWDILNNIRNDFSLLARHSSILRRLPTFVYLLSRLSSLAFVLLAVIFQTAPISNCFHSEKALSVLFAIAVPSTALLFFFRARAVFNFNPFAVTFFGVLWLGVLVGCLTTVPGFVGANIGPTPYCIIGKIQSYSKLPSIVTLAHDSVVFCAISWRLWHNTWATQTVKNGVRAMVFGDYLPSFSKSLLQDGQVYFLTTVACSLLNVIMAYAIPTPDPYGVMFTVPNAALMNIMACQVYRRTVSILGSSGENQNPAKSNPTTANSLSLMVNTGSRTTLKQMVNTVPDSSPINVRKTVVSMV